MRLSTIQIDDRFGPVRVLSKTNLRTTAGSVIWTCQCDCGSIVDLSSHDLGRYTAKKCHSEVKPRNRPKNKFVSKRMSKYKGSAKTRSLDFSLSEQQFSDLILGDCHYCGVAKSNGIDRIDSSVGYLPENSVSCCAPCNRAKSDMSYEDFKKYLKRLVDFIVRQS